MKLNPCWRNKKIYSHRVITMSLLKQQWWKWICVAIMLYVTAGGLLVPLGPGIPNVEPLVFKADTAYTFKVHTYNTHFTDVAANQTQVWFKNDNNYFCPTEVKVIDNTLLEVKFAVPAASQNTFRYANFDVIANNDIDGTFALRDAVTLIKSKKEVSDTALQMTYCIPEVEHNKTSLLVFPFREILQQTIRNTFFHVPMWFAMTVMVIISLAAGLLFLWKGDLKYDVYASQAVLVAIVFGWCGYFTGVLWSKYTWFIGIGWEKAIRNMVYQDIKLAGALTAIAIYTAYFLVRKLIDDPQQRARISAIYNIFSLVLFGLLIYVLPRLTDSVHPGNGGNPAFSKYDLDSTLRMFFYPAAIGWIMFSVWIYSIALRLNFLQQKPKG